VAYSRVNVTYTLVALQGEVQGCVIEVRQRMLALAYGLLFQLPTATVHMCLEGSVSSFFLTSISPPQNNKKFYFEDTIYNLKNGKQYEFIYLMIH